LGLQTLSSPAPYAYSKGVPYLRASHNCFFWCLRIRTPYHGNDAEGADAEMSTVAGPTCPINLKEGPVRRSAKIKIQDLTAPLCRSSNQRGVSALLTCIWRMAASGSLWRILLASLAPGNQEQQHSAHRSAFSNSLLRQPYSLRGHGQQGLL